MGISRHSLVDARTVISGQVDAFLCCASFERRGLSLAESLGWDRIPLAFVGLNSIRSAELQTNVDVVLQELGQRCKFVSMSRSDPVATADAWTTALREVGGDGPRTWLVDVTTFTHEALLILLAVLRSRSVRRDRYLLGYVSASDYDPANAGAEKWLSKGVEDVRTVLGYPGAVVPSRKTHLLILTGFEHERASRLIQVFEPNRVSLGYGSPGTETDAKHAAANARFCDLATEMAARYALVEKFEFPCNDPWRVRDALLAQRQRFGEYNAVIAPMNTKLSTVGCAMAAWHDPSIQLCYAQASQYNYAHYSLPGAHFYLAEVGELYPEG